MHRGRWHLRDLGTPPWCLWQRRGNHTVALTAAGGELRAWEWHDGGATASEGDDDVALQAQRKRPRTSSIREVELVRKRLLACAFPVVQDK